MNTAVLPPRQKAGRPSRLSKSQQLAAWAWFKEKQVVGTWKGQAHKMGLPLSTLKAFINNMRRRESYRA